MNEFNNKQKRPIAIKVNGILKDSRIEDNTCVNTDLLEADGVENSSINRNKVIASDGSPINNIEIIGRDKTEQHGDGNKTQTKNTENIDSKKWFSMTNPFIWIIASLIVITVAYFLLPK
ncbi:MAG: hypothetical protein WC697_01555 [Patescibacteria group bacterium]|jgi:hypothetical protein